MDFYSKQTVSLDLVGIIKLLYKYNFSYQFNNILEEKKSTMRDWEAADYYDSDEDNFLDRTGVIEKKRRKRMEMDGKLKTPKMRDSLVFI